MEKRHFISLRYSANSSVLFNIHKSTIEWTFSLCFLLVTYLRAAAADQIHKTMLTTFSIWNRNEQRCGADNYISSKWRQEKADYRRAYDTIRTKTSYPRIYKAGHAVVVLGQEPWKFICLYSLLIANSNLWTKIWIQAIALSSALPP